MSASTSMGGIISQASKVEKLQEVQHQGPEWQRQRALTAAEEEKLKQQTRVQKSRDAESSLSVDERNPGKHDGQGSDESTKRKRKSRKRKADSSDQPRGGHIIDIIV